MVFWQVMEFTKKGAESRYLGTDFEYARNLYESLESATWCERHGLNEKGELVPGKMGQNIFLGRKFHGIEQDGTL